MSLKELLPRDWQAFLQDEFSQKYWRELEAYVLHEYQTQEIFPAWTNLFYAFSCTPVEKVRVVILGQDPYHDIGQAHGLAFSVQSGCSLPPSLRNIYKELADDLGIAPRLDGDLSSWAHQGVLLINNVMTVRAHKPHSHAHHGWERFTQAIIHNLNNLPRSLIFVLWGKPAQQQAQLITSPQHHLIMSAHPGPLSAYRGFFGSRPFSKINALLAEPIKF